MAERDSAFLWETEAIRSASHRRVEAETDSIDAGDDKRWKTLREANRQTGIPVETLRKWARRGTIPTYLEQTDRGSSLRMVDLDAIEKRATEIGRETLGQETPEPAETATPNATEATPAQGSMIVPVDAWNKILTQLGNLHEAGQQLAAARERAAKAETEARFLRERLAEMREQLDRPGEVTPRREPPSQAETAPTGQQTVWGYLVRRVRDVRRG
jgi:DNA-binding transcriptional MerR regulator